MPRDLISLVRLYQEAANRHNLDAVASLFADEAEYELVGQEVLRGKEQVRALHAYDAGIGTQLEVTNCDLEGETVTCSITERNQWLAAAGLGPIVYREASFAYTGDRISRMTVAMDEEKIEEIGEVLYAFTPWLFDTHPDEAARIFTPEGDFVYSQENGERVVYLLREWRAAGGGPERHNH